MRPHAGGMPLLTDLSLAMRSDPLALIRAATEFVTVIYGPAVTFAFPDSKVEAYRRSNRLTGGGLRGKLTEGTLKYSLSSGI